MAGIEDSKVLGEDEIHAVVKAAMDSSPVIDLHTHLFPASHGELMLWGIDALLTYHYLVSEYFQVAPASVTHEDFFKMSKVEQATLVWDELFVKRLPVSEAQIGVVTTLTALGLEHMVKAKDLVSIRKWFAEQDPEEYVEKVLKLANVQYLVMTNIPFDPTEASKWDAGCKVPATFKAALRIDPLLKGDWGTICTCLKEKNFPETLEGCKDYLRAWAKRMNVIYLMASTPADFRYGAGDVAKEAGWPTATELIDKVMVPIAEELQLPLAMKLGAWRSMAPSLDCCGGGDGLVLSDLRPLVELCRRNPKVKFLATVLSRGNQHELCVVSQKFRNLHIYGCWWYCNNPSIIDETTRIRMEMLGTAFTAQHSDARVLDQLIYKWAHARRVMTPAIALQFQLLIQAGWTVTAGEVRRDVWRLLGGSFEEFMWGPGEQGLGKGLVQ